MRWFAALLMATAVSAGAEDLETETFFEDFVAQRQHVAVLEARYMQRTVTPDEQLTAGGSILYVNPRRILFRYDEPELTYLIDEQRVFEYDADLAQVQVIGLGDNPQTEALFLGFESNLDRLEEAYEVAYFSPGEDECGDHGLRLRPLDPTDAYFEEVWIFLDGEDYVPCNIHVVNEDGSHVLIEISDYQVNVEIDPQETQIWVPEGTSIVPREGPIERAGPEGAWLPEPRYPHTPTQEDAEEGGEAAP